MLNVFVTGATGLVGGEVCARLVAAGHRVTALIHRTPEIRANDGSTVAVAQTLSGDVSQARFGWSKEVFDTLARDIDLVIHCAATVRFDLAEKDYEAVNVGGTRNALTLAEAGGADFLHVSTAYVCGTRDATIRESDPLPDGGFANGYETSKAAGERLVRASGVRWTIARPSIVVGAHEDGTIRQFDTTYAAFKLIAEGKVTSMPSRAGASLDFVPIDYVAHGIAFLAERMDAAAGGTFHLVSAQPIPVEAFAATIGGYPQFHEPALVDPAGFDVSSLPALERRLFRRVAGLYASYFQRDPHFDASEWIKLGGAPCPPTGTDYVGRLIDYCIAQGFLGQAPQAQRMSG